jgi:hypothetical protein
MQDAESAPDDAERLASTPPWKGVGGKADDGGRGSAGGGDQSHGTNEKDSPALTFFVSQPEPTSWATAVDEKFARRTATSEETTSGWESARSKYSQGSAVTLKRQNLAAQESLCGCSGGCAVTRLARAVWRA